MKIAYPFPGDFKWGCATASFQVEGAASEDGRADSIWDVFCRQPGRVLSDHTGDVAVDQYHRYPEDVALMKELGLHMYRFSCSWPRVFPDGEGTLNERGAAYYDRLVDELLANDIEPWMTFFHWDLPQALEEKYGGWRSKETSKRFADYVGAMTARLSDRVKHFFTINEFVCFTDLGYGRGEVFDAFAPGLKLPRKELNQVRHNALYAHGLGVQAIRANARQAVSVGLAENASVTVPLIETEENVKAARTAFRIVNQQFLTTVMEGAYPETYLKQEGEFMPEYDAEEMKAIGSKLDFVGLNMYSGQYVVSDSSAPHGFRTIPKSNSHPTLTMPWLHMEPRITYWGPRLLKEIWNVDDVYITENGCAADDRPSVTDGEIYDTDRIMYLRNHFIQAQRAVTEEWPLKGYFVWSLLDNFEWAHGYERRFGIVYVNYTTLERKPKMSARFLQEVIRAGGV